CGAKDEVDRQLSPAPRGPDVLPVRPWRHKAAVSLPCKKKTRDMPTRAPSFFHLMDNQQACNCNPPCI
ncbi:hypothetical protein P4S87_26855, partial [Aneurinibacillus aneurinilyticus]|uniref:hypothetical protein n=1 Tax=Aneurinibacillus aneurinilyticus TaxID=1391 RepID=UPI002E1F7A92|nr:hypothetical protein [Aneurinibacillus aneurinilyticus]